MRLFSRRVEYWFDVPVQRAHDADAGMQQEVAAFRGADQVTDSGLPLLELLLGLWELGDVGRGFSQRVPTLPPADRDGAPPPGAA